MKRVMYLFLPGWPIDRLRRLGQVPSLRSAAALADDPPADEAPFATVVATAGRRLLAAINPPAAAAGLAPGMPVADAMAFLPGLATRPAEPAADAETLRHLAEWCGRYSPWTAPDGADGVRLDVTGCAHLWGGEAGLTTDLSRRLARQNITHRVAIAGTLGAAWALARFAAHDGRPALIPTGGECDALAPLPVEALRLDPVTVQGLRRVGLKRVGELYPIPRHSVVRRFGETLAARLDQALDALPEPLSPLGEAPTRRVRLSFAEPIADPADLARAIERLTEQLVEWLAREGVGARRLVLSFHRVDGRVERIRIGTARPNRDPHHLAGLLAARLDTVDPGLGIEDMILAAFAVEALPAEQIGLGSAYPHPNPPPPAEEGAGCAWDRDSEIAPLIDRLGARLGLDAIARLEPCDSHIPERASIAVPITSNSRSPSSPLPRSRGRVGVGAAAVPATPGARTKPPRPVRLFRPPEPIEALWEIPDDPPFRFTWRRRGHVVARADGPERIAAEWWRPDNTGIGQASRADTVRDYYRVEDAEGRRFWLFRAGLAGEDEPPRWFLHGLFA